MERSIDRHRGGEISNDLQASATAPRGRLEPSGSVCKRSASGASLLGSAPPDPYPTLVMPSHPILRRSLVAALVPIAPSVRVLHRVSLHAASFRNHSNGSDPSRPRPSASPL